MAIQCPYCSSQNSSSDDRSKIVQSGYFYRKSDSSRHQRFLCKPCRRTFSLESFNSCYRQKKRHLNTHIYRYLVSGISQRRLALLLNVDRKTIVRKFLFLGIHAYQLFLEDRSQYGPSSEIEFDDLETFEHSKLKPLSVVMAVESHSRRILGFRVARMPAKGLLVARSLKKYGKRFDERKLRRAELFKEIRPFVMEGVTIKSDENPHYPGHVRHYFPKSCHKVYKGRRGCVVGQGELKGGGFDPLFSLNHSFAMYRANINRLFRRTWNTTKRPERLALHIAMYSLFHNLRLIR